MERILKLYTYIDGVNDISFPANEPITINNFKYTTSRDGKVPILTATTYHSECLDSVWDYKQYVVYNNEKYWVSKIPSSSKDNTNSRYKYNIEFTSERNILFNTYFYDTVDSFTDDIWIGNKYCSHSLKVEFYGTISELAERINASLKHSNVNYKIVVDDNLHEDKRSATRHFSGDALYISDAIKQASSLYDIPTYYIGNTIHFGYYSTHIDNVVLEYGNDNPLISIQRNNANEKLITRATGVGASINIPHYYPNDSEKGNIDFHVYNKYDEDITNLFTLVNANLLANSVKDGKKYTYQQINYNSAVRVSKIILSERNIALESYPQPNPIEVSIGDTIDVNFDNNGSSLRHDFTICFSVQENKAKVELDFELYSDDFKMFSFKDCEYVKIINEDTNALIQEWHTPNNTQIETSDYLLVGNYRAIIKNVNIGRVYPIATSFSYEIIQCNVSVSQIDKSPKLWVNEDGKYVRSLYDAGVTHNQGEIEVGTYFKMDVLDFVPFQQNLMPSIYSRGNAFANAVQANSKGYARFYDAKNDTYILNGEPVHFDNELNNHNISEKSFSYEDIKPEIKGIRNEQGELICEIVDIAYDENDSDEIDVNTNEYIHPYFYLKLRAFNGEYGFNLFDHAIEQGNMTLQFTSGNMNGCKFEVQGVKIEGAESFRFLNPVQVENGQIVSGDSNTKINIANIIDSQQDTINNEVWIAVLKDTSTFGVIMPNVQMNYRPQIGDMFNIIHILLPKVYILDAERRLDNAIIKDLQGVNKEYFNYSIKFSKVFLAQDYDNNKENSIIKKLDESSKVDIRYNNITSSEYVTSYTYDCDEESPIPEITVELVPNIKHYTTFLEGIRKENDTKIQEQQTRILSAINQTNNALAKQTSTKAEKATTLEGYGITDAKIQDDGTIVIGKSSIKPITQGQNFDWSNIFGIDEEGNVYIKRDINNKPRNFYSFGEITAGSNGSDDDIPNTSGGATTLGELLNVDSSADNTPSDDVMLVRQKGSSHWTLSKLADMVGLDTNALMEYLTNNKYVQEDYIQTQINALINGAPDTLDTIKELADAILQNQTIVDALNAAIGNKLDKSQVGELFTALLSNSTTPISITIGGVTKTITQDMLRKALGLNSAAYKGEEYFATSEDLNKANGEISEQETIIQNLTTKLERAEALIATLVPKIAQLEDLGFQMRELSDGSRVLITPHNFASEGELIAGLTDVNLELGQRIVLITQSAYDELVSSGDIDDTKIYFVY